jgi:predicted XRE-type DNA-binding protein
MRATPDESVEESSGNVFADIGVVRPVEALAKAKLMRLIKRLIERDGLTQMQAAERAGIAQSDISNIARGRGRTYTMDRLFGIIHRLGGDITIEAKIGRTKERITVFR